MLPFRLLRALFRPAETRPPVAPCRRPRLEVLEDRLTPAATVGASFNGLAFPQSNGFVPPDTSMAAGPNHIVEVVNSAIGIYSKTGTPIGQVRSLDTFFNYNGTDSLFDPLVTYDTYSGRFVVVALQQDPVPQTSSMFVAVSNTSDPTAGFTEIRQINTLQTIGGVLSWGDYPKIGFNREAYVITLNMFGFTSGFRNQVQIVSINRAQATDANNGTFTSVVNNRTNTGEFSLSSAPMYAAAANSPMWLTTRSPALPSGIRVLRMDNPLSASATFTTTDLAVTPFGGTPSATQPTGNQINAGDPRILNAEWRGNRLVTTHGIGIGGLATARWYEFNTGGAAPTLTQQGQFRPANQHTYWPAITIAPSGTLGIVYMQSGPGAGQFMSVYAAVQQMGDPAGTFQTPIRIKAGERSYSDFSGPPHRSGDYSGIAIDPVNGSIWVASEYATNVATNNWGTWIANLTFAGGAVGGTSKILAVGNTSDAAPAQLLRAGSQLSVARGVIGVNTSGFVQFQWYRIVAGSSGTLSVSQTTLTGASGLELHLFHRVNGLLVPLAKTAVPLRGTRTLKAAVTPGREIYVQVKGRPIGINVLSQGTYSLMVTL